MLAYSLSMTSQWPPLSGPIRRIFPASFSWRIIFFMPERDKPTAFINSDMLILGLAAISWRIFRSLFRLLFRLLLRSLYCNASFSSLLFSLPTISFSLLYSLLFISGSFSKVFPSLLLCPITRNATNSLILSKSARDMAARCWRLIAVVS